MLLMLVIVCLLADAAVAAVHVGVEMGWWPSPLPECAAPRFSGGSIADRLASMPSRPAKPCDEPTFLVSGIPVSFAAMNLLFAMGFAALLAMSPCEASLVGSTTTLFVFVIGVILTLVAPGLSRENLSAREFVQKGIAAVLVAIGVALVSR